MPADLHAHLLETVKDAIFDLKSNELNEIAQQRCSNYFWYLAELPDDYSITEDYLFYLKVVKYMLNL